jgi:hypothetical protein
MAGEGTGESLEAFGRQRMGVPHSKFLNLNQMAF